MNREESNCGYLFNVLHERVASDDLFEDKTHENVANTLNSLISNSEKGVSIGLEGSWGSGKSTVINLLKNKLDNNEDKKTLFFVFDAWAHDGDPLRKIFLERLIDSIDPKGGDKKLQELKNRVSARTKTVRVTTNKSASKLGKMLSFSALFIPVGAGLLSATNFENVVMPWTPNSGISFSATFGFLFSFSPLFPMLYWKIFGQKVNGKTKWDIFKSNSEENFTQDITEDGERTSIEFERFFEEILRYVFHKSSPYQYDQAVLVIDNLDRVEPEYAQNIWSTLQTFFQHRTSSLSGTSLEWRDKLWFLIPFDREGIRRIWSGNSEAVQDNNRIINTELKESIALTSSEISTSFMEKCFQVVAEVPSPVMSAWINYLRKSIDKAFTGWPQHAKEEFIDCYIQCMSKLDSSPTPRKIHTLVNRAGMLGLQWGGQFSPESLCLYSLYREKLTENALRLELLKEGLPHSLSSFQNSQNIKSELAGLLFGVPSAKGIQLLLTPEIKSAIREGDGKSLKELSETHKEAFWLAWKASSSEWMVSDQNVDDYKINAVGAIHSAFLDKKYRIHTYVDTIVKSYEESFRSWRLKEYGYGKPLSELISLSSKPERVINTFFNLITEKIKDVTTSIEISNADENELRHLQDLVNLMEKNGKSFKRNFHENMAFDEWNTWRAACNSSNTSFRMVLPKKDTFQTIISKSGFSNDSLYKDYFSLLCETYDLYSSCDAWENLTNSLTAWFNRQNREYDYDDVYFLALKLLSSASSNDSERIRNCVKNHAFWQRSANANFYNTPSLPYLVAACDTDFRKNSNVHNKVADYFDSDFSNEDTLQAYQYFKAADAEEKNMGISKG